MALFLQHKTNNIQWAVWKIEEPLEVLLALLPDARRISCKQELNSFVSERRKMEWLSVRVLLYSMLREDKEIGYSSEGKPYLTDHSFFISISHTKGYVAVILSSQTSVGIDIEQYGQRVHRVSGRYVRPDEQAEAYLGDVTWGLLLHWSAKEAVFKRMEDADADLRKLRLTYFVPQEEGMFQVQEFVTGQQKLYVVGYRIHPDFVLTWTLN
ncbi:4'-phosphopantetheinyl transferase superfamily protein [Bacteroides sp. AN502(2024)]|uniref:4'-phosphopantetheinyl transferase family protein n=1 Tax=Bacteroides sp. AN502(2024) TaxID=3160599 RepID=UPI0035147E65